MFALEESRSFFFDGAKRSKTDLQCSNHNPECCEYSFKSNFLKEDNHEAQSEAVKKKKKIIDAAVSS